MGLTMTLIIIEGVDGAGKSTLVEQLQPATTMHFGPIKKAPMAEYIDPLLAYDHSYDLVCDRLHVGELVYGPIYRGQSTLNEAGRRYIEMFLDSRGAAKIILDAPLDEISRRLEHRGEDFLRPQDIERVHRFYRLYGSDHGWLVLDRPIPMVVSSIAQAQSEFASKLAPWPEYIGNPIPDILFVVDTSTSPVLRPDTGTAGELFFQSLPDGVRCGVVPLVTRFDALWDTLGCPRVVALGSSAFSFLCDHGFKNFPHIPHPYEIMRQAPSSAFSYGELIMKGVSRG